jgi:hypothetical protein
VECLFQEVIPEEAVQGFFKISDSLRFVGLRIKVSMRLFIFIIFLFTSSISYAQLRLGVFAGISNYQGDMVKTAYVLRFSKPAFGITANYEISERVTLRGGLTLAKIAGDDKYSVESVRFRNLNFQSKITEASLIGEFHVFNVNNIKWSPYLFAGLAAFHFNPYTFDNSGNKVFLKPLSTEGQGLPGYAKPYSLTQLSIPFGGGIKYSINETTSIGLEVGLRKLFTDFIDDVSTNYADEADLLAARGQQAVDLSYREDELPGGDQTYPSKGSQRGLAVKKDWYYLTGLHFTFDLFNDKKGKRYFLSGKLEKKGYGCPAVPL